MRQNGNARLVTSQFKSRPITRLLAGWSLQPCWIWHKTVFRYIFGKLFQLLFSCRFEVQLLKTWSFDDTSWKRRSQSPTTVQMFTRSSVIWLSCTSRLLPPRDGPGSYSVHWAWQQGCGTNLQVFVNQGSVELQTYQHRSRRIYHQATGMSTIRN